MKITSLLGALALTAVMSVSAFANDVGFGAFAGFAGISGSGTFNATFAQGAQAGGGQSFGKTETFANAGSNFAITGNLGGGTASFGVGANSGSGSTSGSLVNGNGSAFNQTGGIAFGAAGLGAVVGAGASW